MRNFIVFESNSADCDIIHDKLMINKDWYLLLKVHTGLAVEKSGVYEPEWRLLLKNVKNVRLL